MHLPSASVTTYKHLAFSLSKKTHKEIDRAVSETPHPRSCLAFGTSWLLALSVAVSSSSSHGFQLLSPACLSHTTSLLGPYSWLAPFSAILCLSSLDDQGHSFSALPKPPSALLASPGQTPLSVHSTEVWQLPPSLLLT